MIWQQAYYWLTGGTGPAPDSSPNSSVLRKVLTAAATVPPPVLDLTGYTQVPASIVTILPATGSTLAINSATNITATSSTKTITEILLLQTVMDPSDMFLLYATQSPFSIPFTPTRLGSASFTAITVFSDNTFAVTTLDYTFQASGAPTALNLVNAPVANMALGSLQAVQADAWFNGSPVDVSQGGYLQGAQRFYECPQRQLRQCHHGQRQRSGFAGCLLWRTNGNGSDRCWRLFLCSESIQSDRSRYGRHRRDSSHDAARMRLDCFGRRVVAAFDATERQWKWHAQLDGCGQPYGAARKPLWLPWGAITVLVTQAATACNYGLSQTPDQRARRRYERNSQCDDFLSSDRIKRSKLVNGNATSVVGRVYGCAE